MLVGGGGIELEVGEGAGCCGGSRTGTPVRECRSGGIIARDWEVGVRIRRRRGLEIFFTLDFAELAGLDAGAEWVMMAVFLGTIGSLRLFLGDLSQVVPGPVHW